jgi:hypothetical protein
MTQHTPGPWTGAFRNREYSEGEVTAILADGYVATIACVFGQNWGQYRAAEDGGDSEFEANTRLIAAAPELLEALKNVLENWNTKAHLSLATRQGISAAIAKAEGRS